MRSLSHNIIYNLLGNIFVVLFNVLLLPVVFNVLGSESAGVISIYSSIWPVLAFFDLGFGLLVNREISREISLNKNIDKVRSLIFTLEIIYWIIGIVITLIIVILAPAISKYWLTPIDFTTEELVFFIRLIAISIFFRWPISFYFNLNSGLQNLVKFNIVKIVVFVLLTISLYVLIINFEYKIGDYLVIILASNALLVFSYLFLFKRVIGFRKSTKWNIRGLKGHMAYSFGSMSISVLTVFLLQTDKFFLSKTGSLADFGLYTVLFSLAFGIVQFIYPLSTAFFPKINELLVKKNKEKLYSSVQNVSTWIAVISLTYFTMFASFSYEILEIWIGKSNNSDMELLLIVLVLGTVLYSLSQVPYLLESAMGKVKVVTKYFLILNAVYFGALFFLIKYLNLVGVSISFSIIVFLYFLGGFFLHKRNVGLNKAYSWILMIIKNSILSLILFFLFKTFKLIGISKFYMIIEMGFATLICFCLFVFFNTNTRNTFLTKFFAIVKKSKN